MEKTCKKCNQVKLIQDFYAHSQMADGHLNFCKECVKDRVRDYSKTEHSKELARNWWKTEKGRAKQKRHNKKYRENNRDKCYARAKTAYELKMGNIKRQPCEICGYKKSEIHHEDYSEPMKIKWLCFKHHYEAHGKVTELQAR